MKGEITLRHTIELYTDQSGKWFAEIRLANGSTRWSSTFPIMEQALDSVHNILMEMVGDK